MGDIPRMRSSLNADFEIKDANAAQVTWGGPRMGDPPRKKVCIVGFAHGIKAAPFDQPDWEIWSCNAGWDHTVDKSGAFRADRWFELHPMSADIQSEDDFRRLRESPRPVYLLRLPEDPSVCPYALRFPLERVQHHIDPPYFTCTFAYQIALALHEGFTDISLCGVDLVHGSARERLVEAPCVLFWLGLAMGRGVTVGVDSASSLLRHPYLYGYDYYDEADWSERYVRDTGALLDAHRGYR